MAYELDIFLTTLLVPRNAQPNHKTTSQPRPIHFHEITLPKVGFDPANPFPLKAGHFAY